MKRPAEDALQIAGRHKGDDAMAYHFRHPFIAVINRQTLDSFRHGGAVVTLDRSQYRETTDDSTHPAKAQELAQ